MSAENAKKFIEKLGTDEEFAKQFALNSHNACKEFAIKAGFDCTFEEISNGCSELSDDELQKVAAGFGSFDWMSGGGTLRMHPGELVMRRVVEPSSTPSSYDPLRHKGTSRY